MLYLKLSISSIYILSEAVSDQQNKLLKLSRTTPSISAAFECGNLPNVHHHTFSKRPRVRQSSCGAASASPEQSQTLNRVTFGRIPQLNLSSAEFCSNSSDLLEILKSEPPLAVSTGLLEISFQFHSRVPSSLNPVASSKFLLGQFTTEEKSQTLWMTDWWALLQEKYHVLAGKWRNRFRLPHKGNEPAEAPDHTSV